MIDVWISVDKGCWAPHFSKRMNDWKINKLLYFLGFCMGGG